MDVWIVMMAVYHPFMAMRMAVGLPQGRSLVMLVLMVFVVNVSMIMLDRFVQMLVLMSFGEVQPDADSHQRRSDRKLISESVVQDQKRDQCTDEGRQRKVRTRSRGADVPKRQNE